MGRVPLVPAAALAAGLLFCTTAAAQPLARPVAQPGAVREPSLPVVPASAGAFITLKVGDLAKHPDLKPVLAQLATRPDTLAGIADVTGVSPLEVDRVTLFWSRLNPRGRMDPILVVTTGEPFNEARALKNLKAQPVFGGDRGPRTPFGVKGAAAQPKNGGSGPPDGASSAPGAPLRKGSEPEPGPPPPVNPGGGPESGCGAQADADLADPVYYALDRGPFAAVFLVDERTLVFLPGLWDAELPAMALLGAGLKKNVTGPLADALAAASKHTFAAGVYLPPLVREFDRPVDRELVPYTALFAARTAVLTVDLDRAAKFSLALALDDAAAARRAAPVLEEGLATVAAKVGAWGAELQESRRPFDQAAVPMVRALAGGLKRATVRADGPAVLATAEVDVGPAAAKAFGELLQAVQSHKRAELRMNNLKQIGLALHAFHDANGRFPANVYGPKGEVLLSWRVQLLPYLDDEGPALFRQFKLDEPWDSENNKKLIDKMPKVFLAPDREHPKGKTFYQGFVSRDKPDPVKGPFGRPWLTEGEKVGLGFTSITDGTSNTLAVVEAGEGVIWSKPGDLPFGGAVPPLGDRGWGRTPALLFDGSVRLFPTDLKPGAFWPHVTIDGGEVLPDLDDERRGPFGGRERAAPPVPAKELSPAPMMERVGRGPVEDLRTGVLVAQAKLKVAEGRAAASAAVLKRIEALAGTGAATPDDVTKAKTLRSEHLARVEQLRGEAAALEAAWKNAQEKEPAPLPK